MLGLPQGEAALERGDDDTIRITQDWILARAARRVPTRWILACPAGLIASAPHSRSGTINQWRALSPAATGAGLPEVSPHIHRATPPSPVRRPAHPTSRNRACAISPPGSCGGRARRPRQIPAPGG